jgi:hypothetical protein
MFPSDTTVAHWHNMLRYFRFHRGPGGHGGNMDTLSAALPFDGLTSLIGILDRMGVSLQKIPSGAPRILQGRAYSHEEYQSLPQPLSAFPDYADPGACSVFDCPCLISVNPRSIDILMCGSGNPPDYWSVNEQDFRNAMAVEAGIDRLGLIARPGDSDP